MKKSKFEVSKKDKEPKGMKEGSKAEEALDRKQAKKYAAGGSVRGTGCATRGKAFTRNG